MTHLYPKNYARFYDVIYHHQRDGVDNDYFLNHIRQTRGKTLEVGVGTGRMFTTAINQGADIYGIDVSPSMIDVLLKKLDKKDHNRISQQNIIDFKFDFKFDLVIAPFRVMMHLLEKNDQLAAINNVYKHLNPGGRFVFDVFIPDLNQLINGIASKTDFEAEYIPGKKIKRTVSTQPDLINQLINVHFRLDWEEDNSTDHEDWLVPLRFYFRYELEHLVERSGFGNQYQIIGDYNGNELNAASKDYIVICQK